MADPDPVVGLLVQLPRGVYQPGQVGELRPVEPDVHAAAQDETVLSQGERLQQVGERDELPVDADHHLEVEPVGAGVDRRGRIILAADTGLSRLRTFLGAVGLAGLPGVLVPAAEPDHRLPRRLPVVGLVADLVDLDLVAQPGQDVLGEGDGAAVPEGALGLETQVAAAPAAQVVLLLGVEIQDVQQAPFELGAADAAQTAGLLQRVDPVVGADPVAERPGHPHLVGGDPVHGQRETRCHRVGQRDRGVGGDHRHVTLQARQVVGDQLLAVLGRDDEQLGALQQATHLPGHRGRQRGEGDLPAALALQPERDAVASGAEELHLGRPEPLVVVGHAEP